MVSFSAPLSISSSDMTAKNRTTARIIDTQMYDCFTLTEVTEALPLGVVVAVRMGVARSIGVDARTVGSWASASLKVDAASSVEETEGVTKDGIRGDKGTEEEAEGKGEKKERTYLYHFILIL